jgi:hypothetical protein
LSLKLKKNRKIESPKKEGETKELLIIYNNKRDISVKLFLQNKKTRIIPQEINESNPTKTLFFAPLFSNNNRL